MQLNSPIDRSRFDLPKTQSKKIRIGEHSKSLSNKWNKDWPKLIKMCNERLGDKICFDFMGMPKDTAKKIESIENVRVRKEDEVTVPEYLNGIDIFCFFLDFRREEPWARCTAEAMVSGCPVITSPRGGNPDQVIEGNNGFLCKDTQSFFKKIVYLVEHKEILDKMSKNAKLSSRDFSTESVIEKFVDYIEA
jgi:glycosyltransferase involved in cell wall biosynthesis